MTNIARIYQNEFSKQNDNITFINWLLCTIDAKAFCIMYYVHNFSNNEELHQLSFWFFVSQVLDELNRYLI